MENFEMFKHGGNNYYKNVEIMGNLDIGEKCHFFPKILIQSIYSLFLEAIWLIRQHYNSEIML